MAYGECALPWCLDKYRDLCAVVYHVVQESRALYISGNRRWSRCCTMTNWGYINCNTHLRALDRKPDGGKQRPDPTQDSRLDADIYA